MVSAAPMRRRADHEGWTCLRAPNGVAVRVARQQSGPMKAPRAVDDEPSWWSPPAWPDARSAPPAAMAVQPPISGRVGTSTRWAWLLAFSPLAASGASQVAFAGFFTSAAAGPGRVDPFASGLILAGIFVELGVRVLLAATSVIIARGDYGVLRRRGVVLPFPWGWAVVGGLYLIGRAVVLHRRGLPGSGPLVAWLLVVVLTLLAGLSEYGAVLAVALDHSRGPG